MPSINSPQDFVFASVWCLFWLLAPCKLIISFFRGAQMDPIEIKVAFEIVQYLIKIFDLVVLTGSTAVHLITRDVDIIPNDVDVVALGLDSSRFGKQAAIIIRQFSDVSFDNGSFYLHGRKIVDVTQHDVLKNSVIKEKSQTVMMDVFFGLRMPIYNATRLLKIYRLNERKDDVVKLEALIRICSVSKPEHIEVESDFVFRNLFRDLDSPRFSPMSTSPIRFALGDDDDDMAEFDLLPHRDD